MKKPPLYLEFIIRSGCCDPDTYKHEERKEQLFIYVPLSYLWQEGPEDLHVHFFTKKEKHTEPYYPEYDPETGDYIVPDPFNQDGFRRCYHMAVTAKPKFEPAFIGDDKYVSRLMYHWYSPCGDDGSKEMEEYLKPRKKIKK